MIKSFIKALLENDTKKATKEFRNFFLLESTVYKKVGEQEFLRLLIRDITHEYKKKTRRAPGKDVIQQNVNKIYGYFVDIEDMLSAQTLTVTKLANAIDELRQQLRKIDSKMFVSTDVNDFSIEQGQLFFYIQDTFDPKSGTTEVISAADYLEIIREKEGKNLNDPSGITEKAMRNWFESAQNTLNNIFNGTHLNIKSTSGPEYEAEVYKFIDETNKYLNTHTASFPVVTNMFLRGWSITSDGFLYIEIKHP